MKNFAQTLQTKIHKTRVRRLMARRTKPSQAGFISVEMGLTLLLVAVIIVGAVIWYQENARKNSINTNIQYLQSIVGNAKTTYGLHNQYGDVTTAVAVRGHIIPATLRDSPAVATASNPFGAPITVVPATTAGAGTPDVLDVTWSNVPNSQCSEIVGGISTSVRMITVAGTAVKPLDAPLNIATTTTQCEAADNVAIVLRVGRS